MLWDLSDSETAVSFDAQQRVHLPSFASEAIATDAVHTADVVSVTPVPSPAADGAGGSLQLLSLDSRTCMHREDEVEVGGER